MGSLRDILSEALRDLREEQSKPVMLEGEFRVSDLKRICEGLGIDMPEPDDQGRYNLDKVLTEVEKRLEFYKETGRI